MDKETFAKIRHQLGKTQNQLAQLLAISPKAIQSFEQGWRNVPVHAERQILFLLAQKSLGKKKAKPCHSIKKCPPEIKKNCPATEFNANHFCWLINGTLCTGKPQKSWHSKMKLCRECEVFRSAVPPIK